LSDDLTNISYVTLALIGKGGASPQDLVEMHRSAARIYYAVAPSRLYAEPRRLEQLGYVTSVKRPGKTRERTFYTLTRKGLDALRKWIFQPPAPLRIQNEAIVKLMSGDIAADDAELLRTLLTLRDKIDEQEAKLDQARERLGSLEHRRRYLLLVDNLGRRLLEAQRAWLDDVERELRPTAGGPADS
jgi:DNA-binding PadR family transcriptional regulator